MPLISQHPISGVNAGPGQPWSSPNNITLDTPGTPATVQLSFGTVGGLLIAHFVDSFGPAVSSSYAISDTASNVWTQLFFYSSSVGGTQIVWYAYTNSTSPTTVSVTGGVSGPYFNGVELAEFSGVGLPDQVQIPVWNGPTNPLTATAITTTASNELILSFGSIVTASGFNFVPHNTAPTSTVLSPMLPLAFSGYQGGIDDYYYEQMGYEIVNSIQSGFVATQGNPFGNNGTLGVASFFATGTIALVQVAQGVIMNYPFKVPSSPANAATTFGSGPVSQTLQATYGGFGVPPVSITGLEISVGGNQNFAGSGSYLTATLGNTPYTAPSVQFQLPSVSGSVVVAGSDPFWGQAALGNAGLISLLNSGSVTVNIQADAMTSPPVAVQFDIYDVSFGYTYAVSTTTITSDVNPSVFTNPVTFTINVMGATSPPTAPTGTITILDGTSPPVPIITGVPLVSGVAQYTTSSLSTGTHALTAIYVPSGSFPASSGSMVQVVTPLSGLWTNAPYPGRLALYCHPLTGPYTSPAIGSFDPRRDMQIYVDGDLLNIVSFSFDPVNNRYLLFSYSVFDLQGVVQGAYHIPNPPFADAATRTVPPAAFIAKYSPYGA